MNFSTFFNVYISSKRTRKFTISCLIFIMFTMLVGCATYQRIQALKTPRFQTGIVEYKGAQSCMECHEEIYQQWKGSRHAGATDKWFHESVDAMSFFPTKMVMGRGMCFACHGPESLNEGVSCEVCHGINDQDDIEKVHEQKFSQGLDKLRQSESCGKCHSNIDPLTEQVLDGALFEWQKSQAAKENIQCVHCHMKNKSSTIAFHGIDGKYFATSLKLHKVDIKDNELSVVLENTNTAHSLPTGNASNVYRLTATLLGKEGIQIATLTKDIKKTYAMSFGFPAELLSDETLKCGEVREVTLPMPSIDKYKIGAINLQISHIEVDLNNDGEIKEIHRETPRLEKNFIMDFKGQI